MRIAVIGAGMVGVATAYELASDGHEVSVFDRRPSVAAESSFAAGGLLSAGLASPWAGAGFAARLLGAMTGLSTTLSIGGQVGALPWLWRALTSSRPAVRSRHGMALTHLARHSLMHLSGLAERHQWAFDQAQGVVVPLRTARDAQRCVPVLEALSQGGVVHEVIDAARCRALEPGLSTEAPLHAAIHLPQDGVGNGRQFAHLVKGEAQALGARFHFGADVRGIRTTDRPELEWQPVDAARPPAVQAFDAIVVCAGLPSAALLRDNGVRLPLRAVHGYSLTAPVRQLDAGPVLGPQGGLWDERHQVAITRLGERVRVAGAAELGGRPDRMNRAALGRLYRVLQAWYPGAAELARVQHWKGARPTLPDGLPVIGASGRPGLWLNIGHGGHGWTLACGSARLLADQIAGRAPGFETSLLGIDRLR